MPATSGKTAQVHAYVAVDVVLFSVESGELGVLLVRVRDGAFKGRWAFPGSLVGVGESLEKVARRELHALTGLDDVYLEQLRTFGDPDRDPQARVVSTAYVGLSPAARTLRRAPRYADAAVFPVRRLPTPLAYDHEEMAECALDRLRSKLGYSNIVYGLLAVEFTLSELQEVYEIILGRSLDRRNFRKKLLATGLLKPLAKQRRGSHRPATLYRFTRRKPTLAEML